MKFSPPRCHVGMPRSWIYTTYEQDKQKTQTCNHRIIPSPELGRTQQNPETLSCFLQKKQKIKHCSLSGKGQTLPWAGAEPSWCQHSQDLLLPAPGTANGNPVKSSTEKLFCAHGQNRARNYSGEWKFSPGRLQRAGPAFQGASSQFDLEWKQI